MTSRNRYPRLGVNAITAARPRMKEYTMWDGSLAHFGVRVHPSGICPSSKQMGLLSVFHKGGSGSSLFDVKPLGFDGSSGGFVWSVF